MMGITMDCISPKIEDFMIPAAALPKDPMSRMAELEDRDGTMRTLPI